MDYPRLAWNALARLRERRPLVQNVTNYVAMDSSANLLLAIGASPAMVHAEDEVEEFVGIADALVVNIGTLSAGWVVGMEKAARAAGAAGKPWVLDPVGCGATRYRTEWSRRLLELHPTVVRGNASEIMALAGAAGAVTRGVDSTASAEAALEGAAALARSSGAVVAVTGAVDYVLDGRRRLAIANGHALMPSVTALGCALSAIVAGLLVVESDPVLASAEALGLFGLAGEVAARGAEGPGTFRARLADALHGLDEASVVAGLRICDAAEP